ncbi:hypothetical protein CLOBY_18280 [Clostridium saccharobutylicum]|uniref:XkdX family protein n=1 Tax=Clostridium saccharobutylicum TaxID=169679 RepID=UPI0009838BF5|nr:XkdX family protein [Clostridium saccharobutylicum]AQS09697.1 hypothetical protein CLOBY_18280 [Clostridium saccharobutylicum]MBC2436909.1 XkdX family protein [Clostridium saccharobutylicum]NSB89257.1 putative XkdX family phage protein [Clostridium saccharobutylicum]NYC27911.1 putative XkdX family phage protein [Clostridium saccharobutylicum]OOM17108.1 hypothetical protein CLSAB_20560 [Clostridium saccharobutylicum]
MNDNNFWYEIIKQYYRLGLYTSSDLDVFVQAKWITEDEKAEIIGNKTQTVSK